MHPKLAEIGDRLAALTRGPIARGAIATVAIRVLALGLGFAQAVLTARLLGAAGYGVVAVATSVATIAATVAVLGFGELATREVARFAARDDTARLRGFLRVSLASTVVAALLAAAGIAAVALATDLVGPAYRLAVGLGAALVPLLALLMLLRGVFRGLGRVIAAQAPREALRPALIVAALGLLALTQAPLDTATYMAIVAAAALVALLVSGLLLRRVLAVAGERPLPVSEARIWRAGALPFLGLSVLGILQGEVNTLMLGWLAGPEQTGLFQPLLRISPLIMIGFAAIGMRYAPRVAELWQADDSPRLHRITRQATLAATLAAVAVAGAILAAGPWLLAIFGAEFAAVAPALWWIAGAQVFNAACGPVGMLLTMTGRPGRALAAQAAGLAVNAGLGLWLIPEAGTHGAAQAMAGGIVAWNLLMWLAVRRRLGFDPSIVNAVLRR